MRMQGVAGVGLLVSLLLVACTKPQPARRAAHPPRGIADLVLPPLPPEPRVASQPESNPPRGPRGWYLAMRCAYGFASASAQRSDVFFYFDANHQTSLSHGWVTRHAARFVQAKADPKAWTTYVADVEIGRGQWHIDGYLQVDSPGWSPSERKSLLSYPEELKMLRQQVWVHESEGTLLMTTLDSWSTRAEQCLLFQADDKQSAGLDVALASALDPRRCTRATACCRALQKQEGSTADRDICSAHPDLEPTFCGYWLERTREKEKTPLPEACVEKAW